METGPLFCLNCYKPSLCIFALFLELLGAQNKKERKRAGKKSTEEVLL